MCCSIIDRNQAFSRTEDDVDFHDHFSRSADVYARFRPTYPDALYATLAGLVDERRLAWDCATGNGQAAVGLARHFDRVLATDASPEQLARAVSHHNVNYALAFAERLPVTDHVIDLVTVAAGVHWFDLERFYAEVHRVLRPRGVIAVWSYYTFECEDAIQSVVDRLADEIVAPYWPEPMRLNRARYAGLPFPFMELETPRFYSEIGWTLDEVLGFIDTWSATKGYFDAHGRHPVERVIDELREAWGEPRRRVSVRWPLHMRVGRIG